MKIQRFLPLCILGISAAFALAQDPGNAPAPGDRPPRREGGPGGGPGGRRPVPPIVDALDLNHDGVIDADEISKASESLKKLDKNGDGKLTPDEIMPGRGAGRGPGGQGGPGDGNRPPPPSDK